MAITHDAILLFAIIGKYLRKSLRLMDLQPKTTCVIILSMKCKGGEKT